MRAVPLAGLAQADAFLSILPPDRGGRDRRVAWRRSSPRHRRRRSMPTATRSAPRQWGASPTLLGGHGLRVVDAGIIGGPPRDGYAGPVVYASGPEAAGFVALLGGRGIDLRVAEGPVGAASALKMSYAGITKGLVAIAAAMMLAATRAGAADALRAELAASQPALSAWFARMVPSMYGKAYRWAGEMRGDRRLHPRGCRGERDLRRCRDAL